MRLAGTIVAITGLVALVAGIFLGCGALFSWNGRHAVDLHPVTPGTPVQHMLTPEPGRRYTVAVQVVFDRESVPARETGAAQVSAKLPLVAKVTDSKGVALAQTAGWLDPEEAPTVLFGSQPSPRAADKTELVAERLVGSFPASSREPIAVHVDLGADRIGVARLTEARAVIYDDALPPSIKRAIGAAVVGAIATTVGSALLVIGLLRRRRTRRGLIRQRKTV